MTLNMTGPYAIRSGNGAVPLGEGVYGLAQSEVTMAKILSKAVYATGMSGKLYSGRTMGRLTAHQVNTIDFTTVPCACRPAAILTLYAP